MAIFATVMITAFVLLGRWQLNRLEWRRENNAIIARHEKQPVRPYSEVFDHPITDADAWQPVSVRGVYDTTVQYQVRYRNFDDARGVELVSPLRLETGQSVLIDRGFIEVQTGQPVPESLPPAPKGEIDIIGYVRRNENGRSTATVPVDGQLRLINSDAIGATLPEHNLLNGYISVLTSDPREAAELIPLTPPKLTEGPHLSYALQWFAFIGIAVIGLVVLIRGDLRERRGKKVASGSPAD